MGRCAFVLEFMRERAALPLLWFILRMGPVTQANAGLEGRAVAQVTNHIRVHHLPWKTDLALTSN